MSKLLVNARFMAQKLTGVQRYAGEILRRLEADVGVLSPPAWAVGPGFGQAWEQFVLPTKVGKENLLWSPSNTGPIRLENQVVTIHDLSTIEHPEWFSLPFAAWYQFMLPRLARISRHVIANSSYTKAKLVELLDLRPEKVSVVYPGVSSRFFDDSTRGDQDRAKSAFGLELPYLLYVGSLQPRKNLAVLLDAWKTVVSSRPEIELVIVGVEGSSFSGRGFTMIPPNTRFLGYVDDWQLPGLYAGAMGFVFLSLYEGFGLPVLEAMACGTPVLVSNCTSLPEIVGECGMLVGPRDLDQIIQGLGRLVDENETLRLQSAAGIGRARRFDWDQTAKGVDEILRKYAQWS